MSHVKDMLGLLISSIADTRAHVLIFLFQFLEEEASFVTCSWEFGVIVMDFNTHLGKEGIEFQRFSNSLWNL